MRAISGPDRMAKSGIYTLTLSPPFATVIATTAAMLVRAAADFRSKILAHSGSVDLHSSQALFKPIMIGTRPRRPTKAGVDIQRDPLPDDTQGIKYRDAYELARNDLTDAKSRVGEKTPVARERHPNPSIRKGLRLGRRVRVRVVTAELSPSRVGPRHRNDAIAEGAAAPDSAALRSST